MRTYTVTTKDSKFIFTDFMDLWDELERTGDNNSITVQVREMTVPEFNMIVKELATTNTLLKNYGPQKTR